MREILAQRSPARWPLWPPLLPVHALLAASLPAAPRARYLAYARSSADWTYAHRDELIAQWKKTLRSPQRLRLPGPGRTPRDGRHLRLSLRTREKAGIRRPGQGGPFDLRRLPVRLPRIVDRAQVRLRGGRRPGPAGLLHDHALHPDLRHPPPPRPSLPRRKGQGLGPHRREHALPSADRGMGPHEPFGPPGRVSGLGRAGPARAPRLRPLGDAETSPRRRQLGQLADRGRHDLQRGLALFFARLCRRPRPDRRRCSRRRRCITTPAIT